MSRGDPKNASMMVVTLIYCGHNIYSKIKTIFHLLWPYPKVEDPVVATKTLSVETLICVTFTPYCGPKSHLFKSVNFTPMHGATTEPSILMYEPVTLVNACIMAARLCFSAGHDSKRITSCRQGN